MKHNREYEIAWQGLKPGEHIYTFEIGDDFMRAHEAPEELSGWKAVVTLRFEKHSTFFRLHFDIGGSVTVPCDRCGDAFELPLWDEFDLLIKLTGEAGDDHETDEEADIVFIPRSETVIDISNWLYEFVMLSVPLQKVHPDGADGEPGCNPQALRLLNQLSAHEEEEGEEHRNELWKGLQALKNTGEEKNEDSTTNVNKRKTR